MQPLSAAPSSKGKSNGGQIFLNLILLTSVGALAYFQFGHLLPEPIRREGEDERDVRRLLEENQRRLDQLLEKISEIEERAKEAEKLAREVRKEVVLMQRFKEAVPVALETYCEQTETAADVLIERVRDSRELFAIAVTTWGLSADTLTGRFQNESEMREAAYRALEVEYQRNIGKFVDNFLEERRRGWEDSLTLLMLSKGFVVLPAPPEFSFEQIPGVEKNISYLKSGWQTSGKIAEEVATWIPWAGDVYDLSRLKYNWREAEVLLPNAESASDEMVNRIEKTIRDYTFNLTGSVRDSERYLLTAHTHTSLRIAFESANQ